MSLFITGLEEKYGRKVQFYRIMCPVWCSLSRREGMALQWCHSIIEQWHHWNHNAENRDKGGRSRAAGQACCAVSTGSLIIRRAVKGMAGGIKSGARAVQCTHHL